MVESHPAIDAVEGGEDVADDVDGGHGGVGDEARYGAIVVEQVAEHRVGESAGGAQEEATGRCVIDHLLREFLCTFYHLLTIHCLGQSAPAVAIVTVMCH